MLTISRLCCMRLPTAGIVIGWVSAALSLLYIIVDAVALVRVDDIAKYVIDNQDKNSTITYDNLITVLTTGLAIYLTLSAVNLVASVLLIAGTLKERHLMLVPWLINNGAVLLISFLNFIAIMWISFANGQAFGQVFGLLIFAGLILGIQYLIWTTIYSLFHHIRLQREQQQLLPNKAGTAYPSYTRI